MAETLIERMNAPGPKRVLALDGGGVRGALAVGYLARIEAILRERYQRPQLVLRDYFDLIGGTSTGAIIATALAIGMDVSSLRDMYLELGPRVFAHKRRWFRRADAMYDAQAVQDTLRGVLGERRLDDPSLTTGLCVVAKRADTASTWPITNHPAGRYFEHNRAMPLHQVVRASTAAPTYFIPEALQVGEGERGAFVDGGVSMANNPALLLFLVATLQGFPFHWATGIDQLLLVSVGTGSWSNRASVDSVLSRKLWNWATQVPSMLMEDASWQNQLLLQYLGRTVTSLVIDSEVGDLAGDRLGQGFLTYARYSLQLDADGLRAAGVPELAGQAETLRSLSAGQNTATLARIGESAATVVIPEHFPPAFDIVPPGATG